MYYYRSGWDDLADLLLRLIVGIFTIAFKLAFLLIVWSVKVLEYLLPKIYKLIRWSVKELFHGMRWSWIQYKAYCRQREYAKLYKEQYENLLIEQKATSYNTTECKITK